MTKILLVEDDNNLREIYSVRLSAEGYQVISSGNGEEALAAAVGEKPDLIISDVMMPKISGFEMLDLLKSNDATKGIPVIMLTALSSETQRDRGDNLGADRYLVKSQVGLEDIIRTVHEVLIEYGIEKPASMQADSAVGNSGGVNNGTQNIGASSLDSGMAQSQVADGPKIATAQPQSTISEPIINNPSILGTNFASVVDASPTPFGVDAPSGGSATNDSAKVAPTEPSANQSPFNPDAATHPVEVSGAVPPQMPDTPMRVPMPIDQKGASAQSNVNNAVNMGTVQAAAPSQAQIQPDVQAPQAQASQATQYQPAQAGGFVGTERTVQPIERKTPRIDIDSLLSGAA